MKKPEKKIPLTEEEKIDLFEQYMLESKYWEKVNGQIVIAGDYVPQSYILEGYKNWLKKRN